MKESTRPEMKTYNNACAADPMHHDSEYEDNCIRVLRVYYGAREKTQTYGHPHTVVIPLTEAKLLVRRSNGETALMEARAGELMYFPIGSHSVENLLDAVFQAIAVELMYGVKPQVRVMRATH